MANELVRIKCMTTWNFELAKLRIEELGFKRRFVADTLGIRSSTFGQYLIGNGKPGSETMAVLAGLLRLPVQELERVKKSAG